MSELALQIIRSIFLGLVPDVLFFTAALIKIKDLKKCKKVLGFFIGLIYIACMFVQRYNWAYYIIFVVSIYVLLIILYKDKTQIIDTFIIGLLLAYVCITGSMAAFFMEEDLSNYYICLGCSKILLLIPFLFKNQFNPLYKRYCELWNRNDEVKRPIKSITLRAISLILLNVLIYFIYLATASIINILK